MYNGKRNGHTDSIETFGQNDDAVLHNQDADLPLRPQSSTQQLKRIPKPDDAKRGEAVALSSRLNHVASRGQSSAGHQLPYPLRRNNSVSLAKPKI